LVSPWRIVAESSVTRWRTLFRWCTAVAGGGGLFTRLPPLTGASARQVAVAAAAALSAFAVPGAGAAAAGRAGVPRRCARCVMKRDAALERLRFRGPTRGGPC
jgi:hypothetical protein